MVAFSLQQSLLLLLAVTSTLTRPSFAEESHEIPIHQATTVSSTDAETSTKTTTTTPVTSSIATSCENTTNESDGDTGGSEEAPSCKESSSQSSPSSQTENNNNGDEDGNNDDDDDVILHFRGDYNESSSFVIPSEIIAGKTIHRFAWKKDDFVVDEHGRFIGLPVELTESITQFMMESGLYDLFWDLMYHPKPSKEPKKDPNPGQRRLHPLKDGSVWATMAPPANAHWHDSNMYWVDAADEDSFEKTIEVLKRGNFDQVLQLIGNDSDVDGLTMLGMSFTVVTHTYEGATHTDLPEGEGKMWNLLFPLVLPEHHTPGLRIGDTWTDAEEELPFSDHIGFLVAGNTLHGTGQCDFREDREARISVSIYIADINDENVRDISLDDTAIFPIDGSIGWHLAQRGRFWRRDDSSVSMKNDQGRRPFEVVDELPNCPELAKAGMCSKDLKSARFKCAKSCNVYIDNSRYFAELFPSSEHANEAPIKHSGPKERKPSRYQSRATDGKKDDEDGVNVYFRGDYDQRSAFDIPKDIIAGKSIERFVWADDDTIADEYGRFIGLPIDLTKSISEFMMETGLYDLFWDLTYHPLPSKEPKTDPTPGERRLHTLKDGSVWATMAPPSKAHWHDSNMYWVDAADEESFEKTIDVLKRGNFDQVLQLIGDEFDVDGLTMLGMSFTVVTHTSEGNTHTDLPEGEGKMWNLLFPILLPEHHTPGLRIGDDWEEELPFSENIGFLVGGSTPHGTGRCDFREDRELRISASIYIADLNEDNVHDISLDETAIFPVDGSIDWHLAQSGRFWSRNDTSKSFKTDQGRKPFKVTDLLPNCPELAKAGMCIKDLHEARLKCAKSCNVYIDDATYFTKYFPSSGQTYSNEL